MGLDGIGKEKLDVTLERPDVTLYGLIELLFCSVLLVLGFFFFLGCVSECLLLCLLLFLRTVFSLLSVCQPT